MLTTQQLKQLCTSPVEGKPYYRPFICKGDLSKADTFFVGINPATPISPKDLDIDSYVRLLLNYDEFIQFYKQSRLDNGKDEVSRTRMGMNSFIGWLRSHTDAVMIETDVIPYPTVKLKDLKKGLKYVLERCKEICRHFMYYGMKGESFNVFRESVLRELK